MTPRRILLAKMGLDCHDTGVETVAHMLREAGFEVIYMGLHNDADQVVAAAIEEDADAIGVSFLSGQHMTQMEKLMSRLAEAKVRAPVFCGGVIPADDAAALRGMGVADVLPPGTLTAELLERVGKVIGGNNGK